MGSTPVARTNEPTADMKFLKSFLPWLIAVAAVAGVFYFQSSNKAKQTELESLRPQIEEVTQLRVEIEELSKLKPQAEEAVRLRKDNEDLAKLRNEVRQLREEKKQLTGQLQTAQAQSQAAQAQVQAVRASTAQTVQQLQQQQQQALAAQKLAERYGVPGQATQDPQAALRVCINVLRQLDGAKQQWALELKKTAQAVPTVNDLAPYLKDGVIPKCPAGGAYSLNAVDADPTCTIPGHQLPKPQPQP